MKQRFPDFPLMVSVASCLKAGRWWNGDLWGLFLFRFMSKIAHICHLIMFAVLFYIKAV